MEFWEYFWGITILFAVISFGYLSVKIVFRGWEEMKQMFDILNKQ